MIQKFLLLAGVIIIMAGVYLFSDLGATDPSEINRSENIIQESPRTAHPAFSSSSYTPSKNTVPVASFRPKDSKYSIDVDELAQFIGKDTAKALAEGGPYEPRHIRTIAHSLNNLEEEIDELRKQNAPPERIEMILTPYYELQNHYYAVLNELEPYQPDEKSAIRLTQFGERLERDGDHLSEKDREELKREMLLTPNKKPMNLAR